MAGMGGDGRDTRAGSLAAAGDRPRTGLRAMVVEDETELAGLLGSYLERDGFEVAVVHDGLEAVEAAHAVDPDVVVLDLGLPRLLGAAAGGRAGRREGLAGPAPAVAGARLGGLCEQ